MINGKIMKTAFNKLTRNEKGQALPIVLVLLLIGGLFTAPLLGYMGTGLIAGQVHEDRMEELYAADAGVEDAIYKIITDDASLQALDDNDSYTYTLADTVNNLSVDVIITKLDVLQGLDEDYKTGQPHGDWIIIETPVIIDQTVDYVEYSCNISANYTGAGASPRDVESMGMFFTPSSGANITDPYSVQFTGALATGTLEPLSPEYQSFPGGFAFIWRWQKNQEATFNSSNLEGTASFKFKVYDPSWRAKDYFAWFLVRQEDVSFIASGTLNKWRIDTSAEDTAVTAHTYQGSISGFKIVTWEIDLQ
jgi:hypothetical protein